MLESLAKTFESLRIGYVWKALFFSLLISTGIIAALIFTMIYLMGSFEMSGWLATIVSWLGGALAPVLGWFLFPITLPLITYLFLDSIADAIEKEFYPDKQGTIPPLMKTLPASIKLIFVLIALNILVLPLYLVPIVNLGLYYVLNGYLFGREFFELIGLRHKTRTEAKELRKKHRFTIIGAGILIVLAATTPILNLFAPVLATIYMVHVYHFITPRIN
jgi:uncharacterized protein involved in cysteine biosynthesis